LIYEYPIHILQDETIRLKDVGEILCVKFTISLKRAF